MPTHDEARDLRDRAAYDAMMSQLPEAERTAVRAAADQLDALTQSIVHTAAGSMHHLYLGDAAGASTHAQHLQVALQSLTKQELVDLAARLACDHARTVYLFEGLDGQHG